MMSIWSGRASDQTASQTHPHVDKSTSLLLWKLPSSFSFETPQQKKARHIVHLLGRRDYLSSER